MSQFFWSQKNPAEEHKNERCHLKGRANLAAGSGRNPITLVLIHMQSHCSKLLPRSATCRRASEPFPGVMIPTRLLLQHSARVTLFTRQNCSLCDNAKAIVNITARSRTFEYDEVDVMSPGQDSWKRLYEFDTPVVGTD